MPQGCLPADCTHLRDDFPVLCVTFIEPFVLMSHIGCEGWTITQKSLVHILLNEQKLWNVMTSMLDAYIRYDRNYGLLCYALQYFTRIIRTLITCFVWRLSCCTGTGKCFRLTVIVLMWALVYTLLLGIVIYFSSVELGRRRDRCKKDDRTQKKPLLCWAKQSHCSYI